MQEARDEAIGLQCPHASAILGGFMQRQVNLASVVGITELAPIVDQDIMHWQIVHKTEHIAVEYGCDCFRLFGSMQEPRL